MADSNPDVTVVIPSFRGGGAERIMIQLANEFASRGYSIDLLVCDGAGPYREEVSDAVNVVCFNARKVSLCTVPVARYLRQRKPRSVLTTMTHLNVVIAVARILAGMTKHTRLVFREALPIDKAIAGRRFIRLMVSWVYNRCDVLVFVSQCQKAVFNVHFQHVPDDRQHVIPNFIAVEKLQQLASEAVCSQVPVPDRRFILAVGRLTCQKGFDVLIQAFHKIRNTTDCHLLILGEGEERSTLESLIDELDLTGSVFLPGFVSNPFPLISQCAVFASTSRWEGMPNGLIQAVALGASVVSTDCECGPSEILSPDLKHMASLVPVDDVDAIADALLHQLASEARTTVPESWLRRYQKPVAIDSYLDVLAVAHAPGVRESL